MGLFRFSPQEVIGFIKNNDEARGGTAQNNSSPYVFKTHGHYSDEFLVPLLHMCNHLDIGFTQMPPEQRVSFVQALKHLEAKALPPGKRTSSQVGDIGFENERVNPVWLLLRALKECRDAPLLDRWPELDFLKGQDDDLHKTLALALSDAHAALAQGQYRATTVVSVYVMESLLGYWWLKVLKRTEKCTPPNKLHELIKKCGDLFRFDLQKAEKAQEKIDGPEIKNLQQACEMAASYRNLIHPAKSERTKTDHDLGTAHFTLGTVLKLAQRIGADLTRRASIAA